MRFSKSLQDTYEDIKSRTKEGTGFMTRHDNKIYHRFIDTQVKESFYYIIGIHSKEGMKTINVRRHNDRDRRLELRVCDL